MSSNQPGPEDRTQAELLHDLQFGTPDEQEAALERLAAVGEAEALDAVVEFLYNQPGDQAGSGLEALRVLANKYLPLDRYGLAEVLIPFLSAEDWQQRLHSVRLLNTYPNELTIEPIRELIDEAHEQIYAEHSRRSSSMTRALVERTLAEAIMALANGGRLLALPDILEMLEDPALRIVATRAVGVIGSETERLRLEDLAEDRDPRVRDAAQWAMSLMDERAEQFLNPPVDPPQPPPDRLNQVYWAHRQLVASDDDLLQFLVMRVAVEHLILDQFLSEGRLPEACTIVVRRYVGDTPPDHRHNRAEVVGAWEYQWQGPQIRRQVEPGTGAARPQAFHMLGRGALITISYPEALPQEETGLVSFDCQFQPFMGQGWIYRISRRDQGWTFVRQQRTWST
jgi:hypothetical protein